MNSPRFYEDHFAFVWSCLRRMGVAAPELEDAAHDVFVAAHRHRSEISTTNPRSWLFGAVRRIAANHHRRAWRHRRRIAAAQDVLPTTTSVDRDVERTDATQVVERFLDGLGATQRETFVLFELQQCTAREVAEILGININTASARLRVARAAFEQFAARVREENAFEPDAALARCRVDDRPQPATQARVGAALAVVLDGKAAAGGVAAWITAATLGTAVAATTAGAIAMASPPIDDHGSVVLATKAEPDDEPRATTTIAPLVAQLPIVGPALAESPAVDASPALHRPTRTPAATTRIDDALAEHNDWLDRARTAASHGEHAEAARLAAAYRERFPTGVFAADLGLVEVRARCAVGDLDGARRVGEALLASVGGAAHAALLDRTCAADPTTRTRTPTSGH